MAARKNKLKLSDDWKERIRAGVLMDRLLKHVEGTIDMSPTQLKAADILLRKIVPDLSRTEQQQLGKDGKPTDANVTVTFVGNSDTK